MWERAPCLPRSIPLIVQVAICSLPGRATGSRSTGPLLKDPGKLPPGGEVRAVINPSTQTVWSADIAFKEVDGFLDRVDQQQQEVFLVGNKQPLTLAPDASLVYLDEIADADPADIPFGAGASPAWDKLLPGLKMKLMLSPESDAGHVRGGVPPVGGGRHHRRQCGRRDDYPEQRQYL